MFSSVLAADVSGIEARIIRVEADVRDGLPVFDMVGFLASAVREARERVRIAVHNTGIQFPAKRVTVNLSPANLRKEGTTFDLPIAVSLLNAFGYLADNLITDTVFIGELGLDGSIRGVRGTLAMILQGREQGIRRFVVPAVNAFEGSMVEDVQVYGVSRLDEVLAFLRGEVRVAPVKNSFQRVRKAQRTELDFLDIQGCQEAKRAAEIAVSGRHNLLMIGPPGAGKTMLARRLPTIMPEMDLEESLDVTKIYSICGMLTENSPVVTQRPFRAPHHTATAVALTGGGKIPMPGEISLASKGILFLDELPEFCRASLEVLRQPLEERRVTVSRLGQSVKYPADCMFVAAMNPCRCGFFPDTGKCRCTVGEVHRYLARISEPLLERLDVCVEMRTAKFCITATAEESSEKIRARVEQAVEVQKKRYRGEVFSYNSQLSGGAIEKYCGMDSDAREYLETFFRTGDVSMRGITRIRKVARTIADMEASVNIREPHIIEAVALRSISKRYWG